MTLTIVLVDPVQYYRLCAYAYESIKYERRALHN